MAFALPAEESFMYILKFLSSRRGVLTLPISPHRAFRYA